jgi:phosphoserine aminotransferase
MKTVYNFNAGPCILPKEALQAGINALQDFNGSGMSVIEISHRSKDWEAVMNECRALWRELLQIPIIMIFFSSEAVQVFNSAWYP